MGTRTAAAQRELLRWLSAAEDAFSVAEHSFRTMRPAPGEIICFLCRQSAEKDLKGFLAFNGVEPPGTEDLTRLSEMCGAVCADFSALRVKCGFLDGCGVIPRPSGSAQTAENDTKTALLYAADIKDFVKNKTGCNRCGKCG